MKDKESRRSVEQMSEELATFECLDAYESEKLVGMLSHQSDELTYILGIIKIVDNEVVIMLKDKSCHSIIMKDVNNSSRLKDFINDLLFKKKLLKSADFNESVLFVKFLNNLAKV
jgi:hypothetical protein